MREGRPVMTSSHSDRGPQSASGGARNDADVQHTSDRAAPNRLIHERSPYLLAHAHDPVDWYSWGEEALSEAARSGKPIHLSIGYSACHWCSVLHHESF